MCNERKMREGRGSDGERKKRRKRQSETGKNADVFTLLLK